MPQYLLANYLPDDFDPSTMTEATVRAINELNEELEAAGARLYGLRPLAQPARRSRCGGSPMAKRSSPTARIWKPRSTWAVFGYWKPLTWTKRWRGPARRPSIARSRGEVREIPYSSLAGGTASPIAGKAVSTPPAKLAPPSGLDNGLGNHNTRIALVRIAHSQEGKQCGKRRFTQSQSKASRCLLRSVRPTSATAQDATTPYHEDGSGRPVPHGRPSRGDAWRAVSTGVHLTRC